MKLNAYILITISLILLNGFSFGKGQELKTKTDDKIRAQQIREMKFGMFIC